MAAMRTYGEACAAAHALDLIGERWALLVVRELLLGPKRFADLRAGMPGVSPDILSRRLRELESFGVVRRRKLPPPAASRVYELTEWGMELEPAITALGRWGARSPHLPLDAGMGTDSLILSFRTMFDPRAAEGFIATLDILLGEDRFRATVSDGNLDISRGSAADPDAAIANERRRDPMPAPDLEYPVIGPDAHPLDDGPQPPTHSPPPVAMIVSSPAIQRRLLAAYKKSPKNQLAT